mgnify:CR=1 FL=1
MVQVEERVGDVYKRQELLVVEEAVVVPELPEVLQVLVVMVLQ